jgi:hypothetical protein
VWWDLLFVSIVLAFFALMALYARGCAALTRADDVPNARSDV